MEAGDRSVLKLFGEGLIENAGTARSVVGNRVGHGGIDCRRLVEGELDLRGSSGGSQRRRPVGEVEVAEDCLNGRGVGEERDNLHLSPAGQAQQREQLVDASKRLGPSDPGRTGSG